MMRSLDGDWNQIVRISGDSSWEALSMRSYSEKIENCHHAPRGSPGHGYDGWLSTNRAEPSIFMSDKKTSWMLNAAASLIDMGVGSGAELLNTLSRNLNNGGVEQWTEHGSYNAPLSIYTYQRSSPHGSLLTT
jgi:choline dehydrogenase